MTLSIPTWLPTPVRRLLARLIVRVLIRRGYALEVRGPDGRVYGRSSRPPR